MEGCKLSCACANKMSKSMAEPWPNAAKRRSEDPSTSGTALRVLMSGLITTKYDPPVEGRTNGEVIVASTTSKIREGLLGREEGNWWNL